MSKQTIDWLFNQEEARKAIVFLGARNLTLIKAIAFRNGEEEEIAQYSKMVEHNSQQANQEAILWMKRNKVMHAQAFPGEYLYFRFQRFN